MKTYRNGQAIIEYVLFLTIMIILVLGIANPKGFFKNKVESSLNLAVDALENVVSGINYSN